jgi:hypothetical protein
MKSLFLVILAILLMGCAGPTPYEHSYRDTHIKDNIYFLEVQVNSLTDSCTAISYFYRRAEELCKENGYHDYRIKGEIKDVTSTESRYGSRYPRFQGQVECVK